MTFRFHRNIFAVGTNAAEIHAPPDKIQGGSVRGHDRGGCLTEPGIVYRIIAPLPEAPYHAPSRNDAFLGNRRKAIHRTKLKADRSGGMAGSAV